MEAEPGHRTGGIAAANDQPSITVTYDAAPERASVEQALQDGSRYDVPTSRHAPVQWWALTSPRFIAAHSKGARAKAMQMAMRRRVLLRDWIFMINSWWRVKESTDPFGGRPGEPRSAPAHSLQFGMRKSGQKRLGPAAGSCFM